MPARQLTQIDVRALSFRPFPVEYAQNPLTSIKIHILRQEVKRLKTVETQMLEAQDRQISLTDPDARSSCRRHASSMMATSGRGSGVVGYNVQTAVDTEHHLIVAHDVTMTGNDTSQLARMSKLTKATLEVDELNVVADRGYFKSEEILACEQAGITVTLPKPQTSGNKAKGRFVKADFLYAADKDVYVCPAGEELSRRVTTQDKGLKLYRYWTTQCANCAIKDQCTTGKERRVSRWEHEHVLEDVQRRLDENPQAMRTRRETVEHPFGTIKARMGATHFAMKRLKNVATEMALHVLAYNLTRVMNIIGIKPLMAAIRA